jgi:hypothetical protein
VGQYELGQAESLDSNNPISPPAFRGKMLARTRALSQFVVGLGYNALVPEKTKLNGQRRPGRGPIARSGIAAFAFQHSRLDTAKPHVSGLRRRFPTNPTGPRPQAPRPRPEPQARDGLETRLKLERADGHVSIRVERASDRAEPEKDGGSALPGGVELIGFGRV